MNGIDLIKENTSRNNDEIKSKKVKLESYPKYVTIGTHYKCNANCVFCLKGNYTEFSLDLYKEFFEKKMGHVLSRAEFVGFCGFGEIFLMPEIEDFLIHINKTLKDNKKVFTTNGIVFKPRMYDILNDGDFSVLISLHAMNEMLHQSLTRTQSFNKIIGNIKELIRIKKQKGSTLHINLVFLVTSMNIDNLVEFVKIAKDLDVDRVTCNYLTIFQPEQVKMSCFFNKEKTNQIFTEAEEVASKIGMTLILPPKFIKHETGDMLCNDPWDFFYVETKGAVNPCCFAGNHTGNMSKVSFEEIWNGLKYRKLRKGLISGDIHYWCKYCYKHNANNVNHIRSHITFRPRGVKKILKYIAEHNNEYKLQEEDLKL